MEGCEGYAAHDVHLVERNEMVKEKLKQLCLQTIDENQKQIIALGEEIYRTPELGYREFRTTKRMEAAFRSINLLVQSGIAYTGCSATTAAAEGKRPTVAVFGELDCLVCKDHPDATDDGNVHACGHNVQLANLFGCAVGLAASGVFRELGGTVRFVAIPAEECIDYGYRDNLIRNKKIGFYGGKQEYLSRGGFDDVDIVLQCHMMPLEEGKSCVLNTNSDGFLTKTVRFLGKAAHAGNAPSDGVNALNMAALAINNIQALRETFRDEDKVRVSTIITDGGEAVNVVPSSVSMQIMVRAFGLHAMLESGEKVDRAIKAAAIVLGGQVEIQNRIGYLPLNTDRNLGAMYRLNMLKYANASESSFVEELQTAISTDTGDISHLKPCLHVWTGGVVGGLHTKEYHISDPQQAYILPAKMLALTVIDLLYDKAQAAADIIAQYHPSFQKKSYLRFMRDHAKLDFFDSAMI